MVRSSPCFLTIPYALQVLAGLLHLGNVHFVDSEDEAQPCPLMDGTKGERRRRGVHLAGMTGVGGMRWETEGELFNLDPLTKPSAVRPTMDNLLLSL